MILEFQALKEEHVNDVAQAYVDLVRHIEIETGDPYFQIQNVSMDEIAAHIVERANNGTTVYLVATVKKEFAGFIAGGVIPCFLPISEVKEVGYIEAAFIKDEFRNQKLFMQMEEQMLDFFRKAGMKYVELNVMALNYDAKEAFKKLGYTTFREQMRKEIQ